MQRLYPTPAADLVQWIDAIALAITSGSLCVLHAFVAEPHHLVELVVLVLANLVATAARFVLLRGWVFHPAR